MPPAIESALLTPLRRLFSPDAAKPLAQEAEHQLATPAGRTAVKQLDGDSYRRAVSSLDRRIAAEKKLEGPQAKGKYRLMPHGESFVRLAPNARGTVLAFHGFTAGPWQYEELADRLQKEGYNVYAPRLPGAGFATPDGMTTNKGFVQAATRQKFDAYAEARYQEAAALGAPVYTLGLSGGSDVALRVAELHPEVKGVFAMAPFLGPNGKGGLLFSAIRFLDKLTFGGFGRLLDHVQAGKQELASTQGLTPRNHASVGEGLAIEEFGAKIQHIDAPVQFVTTEGDGLSGTHKVGPLYERIGGDKKNGWFHFGPEAHIQHAMISPKENTQTWAVSKLQQLVVDFLNGKATLRRPAGMS